MTDLDEHTVIKMVEDYVAASTGQKGSLTMQTRRVIAALKAIGLKRSEFSAQTWIERTGEYGPAIGGPRADTRKPDRKIIENAGLLVKCGLNVHILNMEPGKESAFVATPLLGYPHIINHVAVHGMEREPLDATLAQLLQRGSS